MYESVAVGIIIDKAHRFDCNTDPSVPTIGRGGTVLTSRAPSFFGADQKNVPELVYDLIPNPRRLTWSKKLWNSDTYVRT